MNELAHCNVVGLIAYIYYILHHIYYFII